MAAESSTMAVTLAGGHGATAARVSSMSGWLVSGRDMVGLQTNGKHRCKQEAGRVRGMCAVVVPLCTAVHDNRRVRVWIRSPVRIHGSRDWREIERASADIVGRRPCAATVGRRPCVVGRRDRVCDALPGPGLLCQPCGGHPLLVRKSSVSYNPSVCCVSDRYGARYGGAVLTPPYRSIQLY